MHHECLHAARLEHPPASLAHLLLVLSKQRVDCGTQRCLISRALRLARRKRERGAAAAGGALAQQPEGEGRGAGGRRFEVLGQPARVLGRERRHHHAQEHRLDQATQVAHAWREG